MAARYLFETYFPKTIRTERYVFTTYFPEYGVIFVYLKILKMKLDIYNKLEGNTQLYNNLQMKTKLYNNITMQIEGS